MFETASQEFQPREETPLHYLRGRSSGHGDGVVVAELQGCLHLNLRGDAGNASFSTAVKEVFGVDLPGVGCSADSVHASLLWLGPDEWAATVVGVSADELLARLRSAAGGHVSLVDVSSGMSMLRLSGPGVPQLLQKASVYDFHPASFGPGRCAATTFAKATGVVRRREDGDYDLLIRRSFADYIALWILDAAAEYGCRIAD